MLRTALITIFSVPNYGSVLQAYATRRMLESNGIHCDIINYRYPNDWHFSHGAQRPGKLQRVKTAVAGKLLSFLGIRSQHVLSERLSEFVHSNLSLTREYDSLESLAQADWAGYDAVIAGSDQIWNPRFVLGDPAFMLSFVPDNVRKTSIASSFATDNIPESLFSVYRQNLSRFAAITVREPGGESLIRDKLKLPVDTATVLDPTLLLDATQWTEMALSGIPTVPMEPYIVLYGLYYSFESRPYIFKAVEELKQRTGVHRVIALAGYPDPLCPSGFKADNCRDVHVEQFVALMRGAAGVVTSSFHGTAFALTFGRPLISVVPSGNADDRQRSILKAVGAEKCAATPGTPLGTVNHLYDTNESARRLEALRRNHTAIILNNICPA